MTLAERTKQQMQEYFCTASNGHSCAHDGAETGHPNRHILATADIAPYKMCGE